MAAMPGLKERAKTLVELFEASRFLWASRPLELDAKAEALLTPEARDAIATLLPELEAIADWTARGDRNGRARLCRAHGTKLGAVAQPLARGADRPHHLAADFRRAGGARRRGKPRPVARPGRDLKPTSIPILSPADVPI